MLAPRPIINCMKLVSIYLADLEFFIEEREQERDYTC